MSLIHPLQTADPSLGKERAEASSLNRLGYLGYAETGSFTHTTFRVNRSLLDSLQKKSDFSALRNKGGYQNFYPFYWETRVETMQPESRFFNEEEENEELTPVQIRVMLNESGGLIGLANPQKFIPNRLLNAEALQNAVTVSDQTISDINSEPSLLNRIEFDFQSADRPAFDEIRSEMLRRRPFFLNREKAVQLAMHHLQEADWSKDLFSFKTMRRQVYPGFDAAEIVFEYANNDLNHKTELVMHISPAGALLHMMPEYSSLEEASFSMSQIVSGIRGTFVVVLIIFLIIQAYLRIKLRVVDTKTAITVAVIAGFSSPLLSLLSWLYTSLNTIEEIEFYNVIIQLFEMGGIATIVSIGFFIITAVGDSLIRQHWPDKIRTLDLVRVGHFFNAPVGITLLRSAGLGLVFAFIFSIVFFVLPDSYMSVNSSFDSDTTYLASISEIVSSLFAVFVTTQIIFMIIIGRMSDSTRNKYILTLFPGLIFAVMSPLEIDAGPLLYEFIIMFLTGSAFGYLFYKTDVLTTLSTLFIFVLLIIHSDGWIMAASPDAIIFYYVIGLILTFVIFGFISIYKGTTVTQLPKYVPDYVNELAQEERIKQELQIARGVQESFLPVRTPKVKKLDLAGICIPAYETGGDYYDFIPVNETKVAVAIGDVSGKGIQAAFYMTFIKGVLHALCKEGESSISLLSKVNDLFLKNAPRGTFISLIFGIIDSETGDFLFSRAGHNPLFHFHATSKKVETVKPAGIGIGMTNAEIFSENIQESRLKLESGDYLILFTDGVTEANNEHGNQFGEKKLQDIIESCKKKSAKEMMFGILEKVQLYSEKTDQHDDMTLVVIKME